MMRTRWLTPFLLALGLVLPALTISAARAEEDFNIRFSWKLKGEYAPFFLARDHGFFTKAGLNVHLGEGAGSEAALGGMLQGHEDVVVIPGIYALSAAGKGMPVKIIALYQPKAPVAIISFPDKPIRTPQDLEGHSLVGTVGDTTTDYLKVFCRINSIDCGKIKLVMLNNQARLPQFMSRKVDALSTYWNIDVPQLEYSTKQHFAMLDVAKYGLIEPGLSVVASDAAIKSHPERLRAFLHALGLGFAETRKDPAAAAQALSAAWHAGPAAAVVLTQVKLSNETFVAPPGKPLGFVDDRVISAALSLLKETGQLAAIKPHDTYYSNALVGE